VIEIDFIRLQATKGGKIPVVEIMLEEDNASHVEAGKDFFRDRRFAGSGTAGNAYDEGRVLHGCAEYSGWHPKKQLHMAVLPGLRGDNCRKVTDPENFIRPAGILFWIHRPIQYIQATVL
jgi:hypothetical protein